jgi:23S rRNA (guanosine2251-2'-O)-methyltransferase
VERREGSRSLRNVAVNIRITVTKRNSDTRRPTAAHTGAHGPNADRRRPPQPAAAVPRQSREPSAAGGRRGRSTGGRPWLWGRHAVLAALANEHRQIRRFLVARGEEASLPADLPIRPEIVEREVIARALPESAVHQGYALLAEPLPEPSLNDILTAAEGREHAIILALDQVTDPQNVGAIVRSAAALGALGVVMTDAHAPPSDGVLAKAASGALERIPLARVPNLVGAFDKLKAEGFWIAGLEAEAPKTLAEAGLSGRLLLVLGAEGAGLRRLTRERCDWLVRIPLSGAVESLNVSAAAACALYEIARLGVPASKAR